MPTKKEKQPLSVTHPELAKEADGWDPSKVLAGSNRKLPWVCNLGHKWESVVDNRTRRDSECLYCRNKLVLPGFNDLSTTNPEIAQLAFGWDPHSVTRRSGRKREWQCDKGHRWIAIIAGVTGGSGCPTCNNKKILFGFNDLQSLFPEIASEADGWDPKTIGAGTHKVMKWRCPKGHSYKSAVFNRTRRGDICPVCSHKKILKGSNDLATTHPELAKEADGWDPTNVFAGSNINYSWKCSLGHSWRAKPNSRSSKSSGCPFCKGAKVLKGFNDLATLYPELAKQADGWDPSTVTTGTDLKKKWKCANEHSWVAVVGSRTRGINCPSCAKFGFDPGLDGYFYFLEHNDWEMFQIGISNYPDHRIADHKRLGWEVLELRGPMDGHLTQQWETAILRMLKAKGADLSNAKIAGKFDGYSEAWSKSTFEVKSIKQLMKITEEFEADGKTR